MAKKPHSQYSLLLLPLFLISGCVSESADQRVEELFLDDALVNTTYNLSKVDRKYELEVFGVFEKLSDYNRVISKIESDAFLEAQDIKIVYHLDIKLVPVGEIISNFKESKWAFLSHQIIDKKIVFSGTLPTEQDKASFQTFINWHCADKICPEVKWELKTRTELEKREKFLAREAAKKYSSYAAFGYSSSASGINSYERAYMKKHPDRLYNGTPCKEGDQISDVSFSPFNRIYLREGPSSTSSRLINFRASEILGSIEYKSVDTDMTAYVDCKRGDWYRVWVYRPEWLQRSHVGWLKVDLD